MRGKHISKESKSDLNFIEKHPNLFYTGIFFLISILFVGICSYTSPLFYFDYSPDSNCYFTVGKGMFNGIVPYKQLFEQKGPYVYFLHGIAWLIRPLSLKGMFPFEVIAFTVIIFIAYKIAHLYIKKKYVSALVGILVSIFALFHPYYNYGDAVEYYAVPAILGLIYFVLVISKRNFSVTKKEWFVQGLIIGVIFFSKFTLIASWVIFYLFIFALYIYRKRFIEIFRMIVFSALGFLTAIIPWIVYFIFTNSLVQFIKVYFLANILGYTSSGSFLEKLINSLVIFEQFLRGDPIIFFFGFLGLLVLAFCKGIFANLYTRILMISMLFGNAILSMWGHDPTTVLQYYELIWFPYIILSTIIMLVYVMKFHPMNISDKNKFVVLCGTVILTFSFLLCINNSVMESKIFPNNGSVTLNFSRHKYIPAQLEFGNIMRANSKHRPTMLNYGSIDMGFYTTSGALPKSYYFQNYNFPAKFERKVLDKQEKVIKNRKVQWVVLNTPSNLNINNFDGFWWQKGKISGGDLNPGTKEMAPMLLKRYKIVARHDQKFENTNVAYWLLERKSNSEMKKEKLDHEKAQKKAKLKLNKSRLLSKTNYVIY